MSIKNCQRLPIHSLKGKPLLSWLSSQDKINGHLAKETCLQTQITLYLRTITTCPVQTPKTTRSPSLALAPFQLTTYLCSKGIPMCFTYKAQRKLRSSRNLSIFRLSLQIWATVSKWHMQVFMRLPNQVCILLMTFTREDGYVYRFDQLVVIISGNYATDRPLNVDPKP